MFNQKVRVRDIHSTRNTPCTKIKGTAHRSSVPERTNMLLQFPFLLLPCFVCASPTLLNSLCTPFSWRKKVIQVEKWFGFSLPEGDQNMLLLPDFPWKVVRVYKKVSRELEGVVFFPLHNANSGEEGRCQAAPVQILAHNCQKATSALTLCFCYVFNCY